jgi:hypothetical protein
VNHLFDANAPASPGFLCALIAGLPINRGPSVRSPPLGDMQHERPRPSRGDWLRAQGRPKGHPAPFRAPRAVWFTHLHHLPAPAHSLEFLRPGSPRMQNLSFPCEPGSVDACAMQGPMCHALVLRCYMHPNKTCSHTGPVARTTKHNHLYKTDLANLCLHCPAIPACGV